MKNINKTKTILFAGLIAAMIFSFSGMNYVEAYDETTTKEIRHHASPQLPDNFNVTKYDQKTLQILNESQLVSIEESSINQYSDLINTNPMPNDEKANIQSQNFAINDKRVSNLLGEGFTKQATGYYLDGETWKPIHNFQTQDGKYTISVTMDGDKVTKIKKSESVKYTHQPAGFGVIGPNQPFHMSGNLMALNAPDYNHNGDVSGQPNWVVLLLNSMKAGSSEDVCNSANMPDSYWAQIGLEFNRHGTELVFTDTGYNCDGQDLSMPINADDRILFFTVIDDASNRWTLYAVNYDIPSGEPNVYGFYRTLEDSELMDTTSVIGTSVFFENQNSASIDWYLGFADDLLVDYAGFKYPLTGNWYYWWTDQSVEVGCHPGTNEDVVIGSFASGNRDVIWDVSDMDTLCGQN